MKIFLLFFSENVDIIRVIKGIWKVVFIEELRQSGSFSQALSLSLVYPYLEYSCRRRRQTRWPIDKTNLPYYKYPGLEKVSSRCW